MDENNYNILFIACLAIEALGDDEVYIARQIAHDAISEVLGEEEEVWEVVFTPDPGLTEEKFDAKIIPFKRKDDE